MFSASLTKHFLKTYVAAVRAEAAAAGRDPKTLLTYNLATVIVDATDAKAQAKFEEYQRYASYDGSLTFLSGWSGVDFSQFAPADLIQKVPPNAITSMIENLANSGRSWTLEELARWAGVGGLGPVFVGAAATVADTLQEWAEETDVDGFNLAYAVSHETFEDVVNHLVPELQRRGVYAREYRPGTLREKLFGQGPYLPPSHPAAQYRDIEAYKKGNAHAAEGVPVNETVSA